MATFSVIMRCLTKGQVRNLKQYLVQPGSGLCNLKETVLNGMGSQVYLKPIHRHYSLRECFSSHRSSQLPVSQQSQLQPLHSRFSTNQLSLFTLPYQHAVNSQLIQNRSLSSATDKTTPSESSKDTQSDVKQEAETDDSKKDSESEKKESWWRGKNSWRLGLIFLGGTFITWGIGLVNIWGAPELDPEGNEIKDEFSEMSTAIAYLRRTWKEMNVFKKKIQDPSREQLLPDPLRYPYVQPPYTLVIELTGVLIHPDWTYNTGWRFKKRPGIDYFLQHVGPPLYEVVIYSQEAGMTADPLVNHLDPQGYIMYRLYRDATRYMDGKHVKDLSCLNREMSRVIMLDCNKEAVSLQPRNSLVLSKWLGEDEDRTLIDLAHFLKTIAASGVEDIRAVLDYYNQFDDPIGAFKDNQRKLQDEEEARQQRGKEESVQKKGWLSGFGVKR